MISGSYFPPAVGGISTMMAETCAYLGEDRVAVLTAVKGPVGDHRLGRVRLYRWDGDVRPKSISAIFRVLASLGLALAKERPAVLQYATLEDAYLAYWTHRALRIPHVVYAHGNELLVAQKSSWAKPRAALLASSCVVANSRYTQGLLTNLGVPADRIKVVHPGCDLTRFHRMQVTEVERLRLTGGRPLARLLLSVGNLVERKGHDTVIRSLSVLVKEGNNVVYLIVGDGPNRTALEQLAASLGVADRVVFLGRVPTAELPMLYSAADIFLMISRERLEQCDVEGFGIVYIEAAACGTPSIAGRSGGVEDAVVNGVTGILVDPLNVAEVANSISALLTDRDLARRLGDAARSRAVSQFSWSRFGEAVALILDEITRGQARSVVP
ncbi:MAG: glycosyltransferase family 4 protein [Burkholderiaceae bacterium]